jgi:hypothetical protein
VDRHRRGRWRGNWRGDEPMHAAGSKVGRLRDWLTMSEENWPINISAQGVVTPSSGEMRGSATLDGFIAARGRGEEPREGTPLARFFEPSGPGTWPSRYERGENNSCQTRTGPPSKPKCSRSEQELAPVTRLEHLGLQIRWVLQHPIDADRTPFLLCH